MKSFKFRGAVARKRREELGLRSDHVAEAVGISRGHLLGLERGTYQPSAPVCIRIAEALDIHPDELREPMEPPADTPRNVA